MNIIDISEMKFNTKKNNKKNKNRIVGSDRPRGVIQIDSISIAKAHGSRDRRAAAGGRAAPASVSGHVTRRLGVFFFLFVVVVCGCAPNFPS